MRITKRNALGYLGFVQRTMIGVTRTRDGGHDTATARAASAPGFEDAIKFRLAGIRPW